MTRSGTATAVAAVLALAACGTPGPGARSGFADFAGVLGCADLVAWGSVAAAEPVPRGLRVTVDVEEWVLPTTGGSSVAVIADDPAQEVAAPAWEPSDEQVLVVVSDASPAARYTRSVGRRAVEQWREAGSPRVPRSECELA